MDGLSIYFIPRTFYLTINQLLLYLFGALLYILTLYTVSP